MKYLLILTLLTSSAQAFELNNIVRAAEIKYELPPGLLAAMVQVESAGNHKAYVKQDGASRKPSHGLLQVQLASARHVGFRGTVKELMRPEVNVEYGAAYLAWLLKESKGDYALALSCYNTGPYSTTCLNKRYFG